MKKFLVITQIIYLLFVPAWLLIWGISFMGFDSGFSWLAVTTVLVIGCYPIALIICSILGWVLRHRRRRMAIWLNLLPMLWVLGLGLPVLIINLAP